MYGNSTGGVADSDDEVCVCALFCQPFHGFCFVIFILLLSWFLFFLNRVLQV